MNQNGFAYALLPNSSAEIPRLGSQEMRQRFIIILSSSFYDCVDEKDKTLRHLYGVTDYPTLSCNMHARLNTRPNKMKIFKIKLKLPELGLARFARKQFIT